MVLAYLKEEKCRGVFCMNLSGDKCYFLDPNCKFPNESSCRGIIYTEITKEEFDASPGMKWRVKKDGRVIPIKCRDKEPELVEGKVPPRQTFPRVHVVGWRGGTVIQALPICHAIMDNFYRGLLKP